MANKTVTALHQEGNRLFEVGNFAEAARVFHSAVDRFRSDRRSDKTSVDEFVKVAGNLCICHHKMGDWNTCVSTARELLSVYPIIPKAYGAIGMCIVNHLVQQEVEQQNEDLLNSPNMPPRSGEEVRRDARRYLVKLGGVLCTPDDAHTYLCRAILLSDGKLQPSLGPYLEAAVRWVSEELLSAGLSLEREYSDGVLGRLSALESSLVDVPSLLDTAPVLFERQSIRVLDASIMAQGHGTSAAQRVEELPAVEAEAILRIIHEGQQFACREAVETDVTDFTGAAATATATTTASEGDVATPRTKPPLEPIDFFLSRQRIPVHVCHAERGGIPRGLTLMRSSGPFAVAQHLQLVGAGTADNGGSDGSTTAPTVSLLPGGALGGGVHHFDPSLHGFEAESVVSASAQDSTLFQNPMTMNTFSSAPESPPMLKCNACGKELNPLTLAGPPPTGCSTCNSVVYCSAACATAYQPRHERYECALQVALRSRAEALFVSATSAEQSSSRVEMSLPVGEVVPGAGWDSLDLHRRVLPLCITVYSGLQCCVKGSSGVRAKVELGSQRRLLQCLPDDVVDTFTQWIESGLFSTLGNNAAAGDKNDGAENCEEGAAAVYLKLKPSPVSHRTSVEKSSTPLSALDLLHAIFFMVRLHSEDHPESCSSSFYVERLLLRHSCEPNCVWSDTLRSIISARYICKGEELTMTVADHFPQHWPWQIRQKWFVHHHGVPCQCVRCLREGADLNDTRGTLSNALVEQLLTADVLGHPCPTPAHQHPTHLFHKQVQRLVEQSKSPQRNIRTLLRRIDELRVELNKYVLPSHYLLEDLRRALINVTEPDGHTAAVTSEGQDSMLFWEALWSGAIPAKRQQIRLFPTIFECGRRRRIPANQQRRRRRTQAGIGAGTSSNPLRQEDGAEGRADRTTSPAPLQFSQRCLGSGARISPPSDALHSGCDDDEACNARAAAMEEAVRAAQATPPRSAQSPPLVATKDFSSGRKVVDLFYGSYQTWYM